MTTSNEEELGFAGPESTNLTCDLVDMTVESIISFNDELMISLTGGNGLLTVDGEPVKWDHITQMELNVGFAEHPENAQIIKLMTDVLEEWRSEGTKLRLLSAPGSITTLVEDTENWLPIPCGTLGT